MAVVEKILRWPGVDLNHEDHEGRTAVDVAAKEGHTEIVSLLLERPELTVDWNDGNRRANPLCLAIASGHVETARRIIERHGNRISVNSKSAHGRTPLCHAIDRGHDALLALLLEQPELDVNLAVDFAATALHLAAVYLADESMLRLFLRHPRIDVNVRNCHGATPLVNAVKRGYGISVLLLLQHPNIVPDRKDDVGMTALSWAAHLGSYNVVKMLLNRQDVDPNARDDDGMTPLSIAV
ncbi:uncharacterized protein TRIREDRAFT_58115, partial [Trichoderma reesei QM6a]